MTSAQGLINRPKGGNAEGRVSTQVSRYLRKILAEILAGVPDDEQAKIIGGNAARVYKFVVARLTVPG